MKVVSQRSIREPLSSRITSWEFPIAQSSWSWYKEKVGIYGNSSFTSPGLLEQINTTKDVSDFLWYVIRYVQKSDFCPDSRKNAIVLQISKII